MKPITETIQRGSCTITVRGKASRKGWLLFLTTGGQERALNQHKLKKDVLQAALDACEPGTADTYLVRPVA
jgi:hypothetical protein